MTQSIATPLKPTFRFCWLLGWQIDCLYIFVPSVIAFLLFGIFSRTTVELSMLAVLLYSVNVFHQGGTLFHFFDRRNRAYYSSNENRLNYIILPLLSVHS